MPQEFLFCFWSEIVFMTFHMLILHYQMSNSTLKLYLQDFQQGFSSRRIVGA